MSACLPPPGDSYEAEGESTHCAAKHEIPKGWFSLRTFPLEDVCAGPVEGVTGPAHTCCQGRLVQTAGT